MPRDIDQVKAIFAEALEFPAGERSAFLDRACGEDAGLRAEVDAYLLAEDEAGEFLSQPSIHPDLKTANWIPTGVHEKPGTIIGRYKLLQLIGEGGFGSVFMAEQQVPVRRRVALKIIKLGMDTRQVIARFESERQVLAMLDHPNIAKVLDAGETETGRPYFVMELVRGIPITQYCDQNKLATLHRLELFIGICHALQHAHQKGIIHRDIKPSNILVTLHDGIPVPKLIDFGIAKATQSRLTEMTVFTEFRQMIGTPAYMSPEQAEMSGLEVDTRSDIYSLGVLLYELLTGTTPFSSKELAAAAYGEIQRIIREVDPPKPSTRLNTMGDTLSTVAANRSADPRKFRLSVRGELDWIVMKALEKDRTRRYESAGEMARDVGRHLEDQPVEACPPSAMYLLSKFYRRHRTAFVTIAAFLVVILAGALIYVRSLRVEQIKTETALHQAQDQRTAALLAEAEANKQMVASAILQARGSRQSIAQGRRFDSLKALQRAAKIDPSVAIRSQAAGCLVLADVQVQQQWQTRGLGVCFSHDGTLVADIDRANGEVSISHVPPVGSDSGNLVHQFPAIFGDWVKFSPDDRLIAITGRREHSTRVFSLDGKQIWEFPECPAFDFTPDGAALAVAKSGGPVVIYDLRTRKPRSQVKINAGEEIKFSPDGSKIATWECDDPFSRDVAVSDLGTGEVTTLSCPDIPLSVAWHPGGHRLAVGNINCKIYQWKLTPFNHPVSLPTLTGHTSGITSIEFSHGGDVLASSALSEGRTMLWDAVANEPVLRFGGGPTIGFSPDDRSLTMADYQHRIMTVEPGRERHTFMPPPRWHGQIGFSSDGLIMACGGDNVIRFWNLSDPSPEPLDLPLTDLWKSPLTGQDGFARQVLFTPDGAALILRTDLGLWRIAIKSQTDRADSQRRSRVRKVQIDPAITLIRDLPTNVDGQIELSTDGRHVAIAQRGQLPCVVDLDDRSGDVTFDSASLKSMRISISPDQTLVATATYNAQTGPFVSVWDAQTSQRVFDIPFPDRRNPLVGFTPDGRWLLTSTQSDVTQLGLSQLWDAKSGMPGPVVSQYRTPVAQGLCSRDSRSMMLSNGNWGVKLVDLETGSTLVTLDDLDEEWPVTLSPDGGQLVTFRSDGTLRMWNLRLIRQELAEINLDWPAPAIPAPASTTPIELSVANRQARATH